MTPLAPSGLEAKEQDDMEEAVEEALVEEVDADDVAVEVNHSTSILSLSTKSTAAVVDLVPALTTSAADPITTR